MKHGKQTMAGVLKNIVAHNLQIYAPC